MNKSYFNFYDKVRLSKDEQIEIMNQATQKESKSVVISKKANKLSFACCMVIVVLLAVNYSTCITFCKNIYNELRGIVHVNGKEEVMEETDIIPVSIPENMEEISYNGITYKSKKYTNIFELENELGIDILEYPYTVELNTVLQIEDDKDVLIHVEPKANTEKEPIMIYMNFSIIPTEQNSIFQFEDTEAKTYIDQDGKNSFEQLGNEYKIVETYNSENLGINVAIVKDTLLSTNNLLEQNEELVYFHALFVYKNIEYKISMSGTLDEVKQCVEKFEQ